MDGAGVSIPDPWVEIVYQFAFHNYEKLRIKPKVFILRKKQTSGTLTRQAKTPEEIAILSEKKITSEFLKRIKQVKLDPAISRYADLVSGLFENGQWTFICSQHVSARFANEEELKEHFRKEAHKQSQFGKSQSTYD
ncbi:MAG: hypothetical protein OK439_02345 [Thaumarchaeota archaeon]|nr:hypothetical protein [Nitrososphaerota archaeon]